MTLIHWKSPISADFGTASDWSTGTIPGGADAAILDAPGAGLYTVSVSTAQSVSTFRTAANATLAIGATTFTVANGTGAGVNLGTVTLGNDATLAFAGALGNSGTIRLNSTGHPTALRVLAAGGSLTGAGSVILSANPNNRIVGTLSGGIGTWSVSTLANANTIAGSGLIGTNLSLTNSGVIDATDGAAAATNRALTIATGYIGAVGSNTVVNSGLLEATNPHNFAVTGGLILRGVTIADDPTLGVIMANGAHTHVDLQSATISGGHLRTLAGGLIHTLDQGSLLNGTAHTVFNQGALQVDDATALTLQGVIANSGVISLAGGADTTRLLIGIASTLTGGGTLVLSDSAANQIAANGATGSKGATPSLTNVDNTISGAGKIGDRTGNTAAGLTLINQAGGVIDASGAKSLTLYTVGVPIVNDGLFEATGKGGLILDRDTIGGAGRILAGAGSTVFLKDSILQGGTLQTSGAGLIQVDGVSSVLDGSAATVNNQGALSIQGGDALTLKGVIANSGTITLSSGATQAGLLADASGVTLTGGGSVVLLGAAGNSILDGNPGGSLNNFDNTIVGAGQIGGASSSFFNETAGVVEATGVLVVVAPVNPAPLNFGVFEADGAGALTVEGPIRNDGLLETNGGTLTVTGGVSDNGSAILNGGTMVFQGAFDENVTFAAAGGSLTLAQSLQYTHAITGFVGAGASLDLTQIGFVGAGEVTFSVNADKTGGVLRVSDGVHTAKINLVGNYAGLTFGAKSDGHGGTTISGPAVTATQWMTPTSGAFTTDSRWSGGKFPRVSNNALLTVAGAAYTVTSTLNATINSLQTASNATLAIASKQFAVIHGTGSGATAGKINVAASGALLLGGDTMNTGAIVVDGDLGLSNGSIDDTGGGTLVVNGGLNLAGGRIVGGSLKVAASATVGVTSSASGAGGPLSEIATQTLVNDGTITVQQGAGLTLDNAVDNAGSIRVIDNAFATLLRIGGPGVSLSGGGQVTLGATGAIVGVTPSATLTNIDNTITGSGELGAGELNLVNEAGGVIDGEVSLVVDTGSNAILNAGLIRAGSSTVGPEGVTILSAVDNTGTLEAIGILTVKGDVTGAGSGEVAGGTLSLLGAFEEDVTFTTKGGTLSLAHSQSYAGTISGFPAMGNASIVLTDIGSVDAGQATFIDNGKGTGGILTVTDGVHTAHLHLAGDYSDVQFDTSSHTGAGTAVVAAAQFHWSNPAGGAFDFNGNWAGGVAPGPGAAAVLGHLGAPYTVTLDGAQAVFSLQTGSGVTLSLNSGSTLSATVGTGSGVNAGTILAQDANIKLGGLMGYDTTLDNIGVINVGDLVLGTNTTFTGGGQVALGTLSLARTLTLENQDNTILLQGRIDFGGDLSLTLLNDAMGVIDANGGGQLSYIGNFKGSVRNAGVIEVTGAGGLSILSAVENTGVLKAQGSLLQLRDTVTGGGTGVVDDGTLEFDAGFAENVAFVGATGSLTLALSQAYTGSITGFSKSGGTQLDLRDIAFTGTTKTSYSGAANGGILTVTDGTHTAQIHLVGDYLASTFVAASDGAGGTLIHDPAGAAAFRQAAASLGPRAAEPLAWSASHSSSSHAMLAVGRRFQMA